MGNEPVELERDIERTRRELGQDVDALADRVTPSRIAQRRMEGVKQSVSGMKDKVMGSAESAGSTLESAAHAPVEGVRRQTRGNPLAVGVIAFGVGWLVSSLAPVTEPERQAGRMAREKAQPLADEAKNVGQEMVADLREPAQEAVQAVKDSAGQAASELSPGGSSQP